MSDRQAVHMFESGQEAKAQKEILLSQILADVREPYHYFRERSIGKKIESGKSGYGEDEKKLKKIENLLGLNGVHCVEGLTNLTKIEFDMLYKNLKKMEADPLERYEAIKPVLEMILDARSEYGIKSHEMVRIKTIKDLIAQEKISRKLIKLKDDEFLKPTQWELILDIVKKWSMDYDTRIVSIKAFPTIETIYLKKFIIEYVTGRRLQKEKERVAKNLLEVEKICDSFFSVFRSLDKNEQRKAQKQRQVINQTYPTVKQNRGALQGNKMIISRYNQLKSLESPCYSIITNIKELDVEVLQKIAA